MSDLDALVAELEATAARLRDGELAPDDAAALVERCAELAGALGAGLEREARVQPEEEPPGQEKLL